MSWVRELARPEIVALKAYEHAAWEAGFTRLHANELPWWSTADRSVAGLNRYPEPHPKLLMQRLAAFYEVPTDCLLAGRGSDEAIDLLVRCYLRAGQDAVLITPPTFGMYAVATRIQGAQLMEVPLRRELQYLPDFYALRAAVSDAVKLVFLCSPNNPTGNMLSAKFILRLARELAGRALVVVDEAYIEFAGVPSLAAQVQHNPGLVVLRTLSKAHGLAGARCGALIAHPEIIALTGKVIPPYAIAQPSIEAVLRALEPDALAATAAHVATLIAERARLTVALAELPGVERVWPSAANFLLVEFADAQAALHRAREAGFLLRDLSVTAGLQNGVRISLGTPEQNDRLLASLA